MTYISDDDLDYFCEQSTAATNMMIAGMTTLMSSNAEKMNFLENQTWFQRMCNTITGKNRMTIDEMNMNMMQINGYMTEAISQLYDRNKVDHEIMLSLGNRMNELYESQIDLKEMLGSFVNKLNQKIVSIDNFHMLIEEINQKVYNGNNRVASVCQIAAQLDVRTIHDGRKMDILKRAMYDADILTKAEILYLDFLVDLLGVSDDKAGVISLVLDETSENYTSEIARDVMMSYFGLPNNIRKMKSPRAVAENVLVMNQIDLSYTISTAEFFDGLIAVISKIVIEAEMEANKKERQEKYQQLRYLLDNYTGYLYRASAIVGELLYASRNNIHLVRELTDLVAKTKIFENDFVRNCQTIGSLYTRIIKEYPGICPNKIETDYFNSTVKVNITLDGRIFNNGIIQPPMSLTEFVENNAGYMETFKEQCYEYDDIVYENGLLYVIEGAADLYGTYIYLYYILFHRILNALKENIEKDYEEYDDILKLVKRYSTIDLVPLFNLECECARMIDSWLGVSWFVNALYLPDGTVLTRS